MALVWRSVRHIFWINFNKPHRKLGLVFKDGLQVVPRGKKTKQLYDIRSSHTTTCRSRPFLNTAQKYFSQALVSPSSRYRHIIPLPHVRLFHTTRRLNIPPVVWAILKPLGKVWAMLWGRYIRRWWGALSTERRSHYKTLFGGMKGIIFGVVFALVGATVINYVMHLEKNPMTQRLRFISMSKDQVASIVKYEEETYLTEYKDKLLSSDKPVWKGVAGCANRLLIANKDESPVFSALKWRVTVVDDTTVNNAFVLPNGHIFVFTGLLKDLENVDQLAVILGHEIAHAVMDHAMEHVSRGQFLDVIRIGVLAAIWTFVPGDGIAIITQWFYNKLMKLMMDLPYSRELENEADEVGLLFAAKACYDVREAPALWAWQHAKVRFVDDQMPIPEFLSTHPANESRTETLKQMLPKALKLREECKCSKLDSSEDPWVRVCKVIDDLKAAKENAAIESTPSDERV